jgi:hypothetical protein
MRTTQSKTHVPAKASVFHIIARLAAALLLAALVGPSASAQFIYVANAGEDTVSKIDITTNTEVARYATWFTAPGSPGYVAPPHNVGVGPAPSRLLEDSAGDLFVLNRFFDPGHSPVLVKIAPNGGTPATTSTGPVAKTLLDTGTTNDEIDPGDTKDVRILWGKKVGPPGGFGRALCMDTSDVLWVGMWTTKEYYKVDPNTGNTIGGPISTGSHRPYGCQVDTNGTLWSADGDSSLAEINTATNQVTIRDHVNVSSTTPTNFGTNYALSLFDGCGSEPSKIYLSGRSRANPSPFVPGKTYIAYNPQTTSFNAPPLTVPQFESWSVAVDMHGNILSGEFGTGRVIKTDPIGNVLWDTNTLPGGPTVGTGNLHGLIVDKQYNVWAVDLNGNRVVKYAGGDGHWITTTPVGVGPYTYGNPPPPTCPCAPIREQKITCEKQSGGTASYSWSFTFTNNSPFSMPATTINISSTQVTSLTPAQVTFQNPVPPNGQATVSGTFDVANPVPGSMVCLDIRLNAGDGWCCPIEQVCFALPECPTCAKLEGQFKCSHGRWYLELSVTNLGPTAAAGVQVFSNTAGVMVTPSMTMQNFPQNTAVTIPLTLTGATPGQVISLTVNLHGPIDPTTGVYSWCCTAIIKVTYPNFPCHWWPDGWIWDDINANGIRDSGENGLPEWTVTLIDAKGMTHTTKSDAAGKYQFEEIEPGKYRLSVQPPKGWRSTTLKGGVNSLSVEGEPKGPADFGFVKTR